MVAIIFWMTCFAVMAAWVAAEWMIFSAAANVCRDPKHQRRVKVWSVAMTVADIPFACLSRCACFCMIMGFPRTPNGYCFHFAECPDLVLHDVLWLPFWLVIAPLVHGLLGLCCAFMSLSLLMESLAALVAWRIFDFFMSSFTSTVLAIGSIYLVVWPFMRGKIMWCAPERSKLRTTFVFFATYWPYMLLIAVMNLAEGVANARGGVYCDLLD